MTSPTQDLRAAAVKRPTRGPGPSARVRVTVATAAGACAAGLVALLWTWQLSSLLGWDVTAVTWVVWMWLTVWHLDAQGTRRRAEREDPGRAAADWLLLAASVASLLAIGLVIERAGNSVGLVKAVLVGLSIASVICSWSVVHTVFMLRYARLYYAGADGGVDFHQRHSPRILDFAYLAFTIAMTFQVSDTDLTDAQIRATALRHALLSYVFGAVIIALMINLVAGLTR